MTASAGASSRVTISATSKSTELTRSRQTIRCFRAPRVAILISLLPSPSCPELLATVLFPSRGDVTLDPALDFLGAVGSGSPGSPCRRLHGRQTLGENASPGPRHHRRSDERHGDTDRPFVVVLRVQCTHARRYRGRLADMFATRFDYACMRGRRRGRGKKKNQTVTLI